MQSDAPSPVLPPTFPLRWFHAFSSASHMIDAGLSPGLGAIAAPDARAAFGYLRAVDQRYAELHPKRVRLRDATSPRDTAVILNVEDRWLPDMVVPVALPLSLEDWPRLGTEKAAILAHAMAFPADVGPCFEVCFSDLFGRDAMHAFIQATTPEEARVKFLRVLPFLLSKPTLVPDERLLCVGPTGAGAGSVAQGSA